MAVNEEERVPVGALQGVCQIVVVRVRRHDRGADLDARSHPANVGEAALGHRARRRIPLGEDRRVVVHAEQAVHLVAALRPPALPVERDVGAGPREGDRVAGIEPHRAVRVIEVFFVPQEDAVVVHVAGLHGVAEDQRGGAAARLVRRVDVPRLARVAERERENRVPGYVHREVEGHREADRLALPVGVVRQQRGGGHLHRADRTRAVHLVAALRARFRMVEVRRRGVGHARDRAVLGFPVAAADQCPVLVPDPDAVGVLLAGRHGVAERQRLRARAAQKRRALGASRVQHEVRGGSGADRLAEGHRDLDRLARPVGVGLQPRRRRDCYSGDRRRIGRVVVDDRALGRRVRG